jgi:GABA(A) receptor-associated protein
MESHKIFEKYPDRIPIIVKKVDKSNVPNIDKTKYLVPKDLTMGQFLFVIRKRIKLRQEQGLYIFVNGTIPSTNEIVSNIYNKYKNNDGFLYVEYAGENTFG